ncbi:unnamed protein product, partial [Discosporangium mesarthrocarpum]
SPNAAILKGFKDPVGATGPNKGPAGAFSGNAMWRLVGGVSAAAKQAQGAAADGQGGYSNPLAAMRAGGGGGSGGPGPGSGSGSGPGSSGGFFNPLSSVMSGSVSSCEGGVGSG